MCEIACPCVWLVFDNISVVTLYSYQLNEFGLKATQHAHINRHKDAPESGLLAPPPPPTHTHKHIHTHKRARVCTRARAHTLTHTYILHGLSLIYTCDRRQSVRETETDRQTYKQTDTPFHRETDTLLHTQTPTQPTHTQAHTYAGGLAHTFVFIGNPRS